MLFTHFTYPCHKESVYVLLKFYAVMQITCRLYSTCNVELLFANKVLVNIVQVINASKVFRSPLANFYLDRVTNNERKSRISLICSSNFSLEREGKQLNTNVIKKCL